MKWVVPQARMNSANSQNIQPNISSRRLSTSDASPIGMAKYARPVAMSDPACSQSSPGSHNRQIPCGDRPCSNSDDNIGPSVRAGTLEPELVRRFSGDPDTLPILKQTSVDCNLREGDQGAAQAAITTAHNVAGAFVDRANRQRFA